MTMQTIMIMTINDYDYAKQSTISIIIEPAQLLQFFSLYKNAWTIFQLPVPFPQGKNGMKYFVLEFDEFKYCTIAIVVLILHLMISARLKSYF